MLMSPSAESITHFPHAVHATLHCSSASSPPIRFLHWTIRCALTGLSSNSDLGHASTQSPHAVHLSISTIGRPVSLILIASNVHDRSQSARPRQPHAQPFPPPATAAAAAHVGSPRYS